MRLKIKENKLIAFFLTLLGFMTIKGLILKYQNEYALRIAIVLHSKHVDIN